MKNYGIDLKKEAERIQDEDHIFGAQSPLCIAQIPEAERSLFLPAGEVQRSDKDDMMDCATRGPANIYETKFTFLYNNNLIDSDNKKFLEKYEYFEFDEENNLWRFKASDAYNAIKSGTTRNGNSLKDPLHSFHRDGIVPKHLLPLGSDMTWEEYHDPARNTPLIEAIGSEFAERFSLKYDRVYLEQFKTAIRTDLLDVAGYAWPEPIEGIYPRVDVPPNHAFVIWSGMWKAFDNYIDSVDNDFNKDLAIDYKFFNYGYRAIISKQWRPGSRVSIPQITQLNWVDRLLKKIFSWLFSDT